MSFAANVKFDRLAGQRMAIFLGPVPDDKLPKDAMPGTLMPGTLKLGKLSAQSGAGDIPSPLHFEYRWTSNPTSDLPIHALFAQLCRGLEPWSLHLMMSLI